MAPAEPRYWCTYLDDWVAIKRAWGLSMDADEADAIREGLRVCDRMFGEMPCWGGTDLRWPASRARATARSRTSTSRSASSGQ